MYQNGPPLRVLRRSGQLERGHCGSTVRFVQEVLNVILPRRRPLQVDGFFGARTEAAVWAFQRWLGVPATGTVETELFLSMQRETIRVFEARLRDVMG